MIARCFNKIVVAKYSPEIKCFVEDGAILIVLPKKLPSKIRDSVSHFFVDSLARKLKSKYGWVKEISPFSFEEFVEKYYNGATDKNELLHAMRMLEGISNLDPDTPVTPTYWERGVEVKTFEFKVHKVFF